MNDPWLGILCELDESSTALEQARRKSDRSQSSAARDGQQRTSTNGLIISRIEWQTSCTILVSWSDPTRGRYVDQIWRMGFARISGICRLSGVLVQRGDPVFRPLYRKGAEPPNARDMILAATLPAA